MASLTDATICKLPVTDVLVTALSPAKKWNDKSIVKSKNKWKNFWFHAALLKVDNL